VLFRQLRAGENGRAFRIFKFRTMIRGAEAMLPELVSIDDLTDPMFKIKSDPRVTRVGRFLRRTSLDELPQLLNVLRGEMSIVGPRPELMDLVERYSPEHEVRLRVKPGITGPWQVYGRSELSFEEVLAVEREYVENLSLARDLRIVLMTLPAVIGRRGAF
jgi:lipopolysaccharide/colanic/teichoic acid biosynthesis glycosyltransferase